MSDNYYSTRLRWYGRCGSAKRDGVSVALTTAPDLGDGPVNELDYIPGMMRVIRRRAVDPRDDMTTFEVVAADVLLAIITKGKDIDQSS